jgi:hypothetical protein
MSIKVNYKDEPRPTYDVSADGLVVDVVRNPDSPRNSLTIRRGGAQVYVNWREVSDLLRAIEIAYEGHE